jgi:hypothetical protein
MIFRREISGVQCAVGLHHLAQRAVDAKAHGTGALVGLDVDVARAVLGRLRQQRVEHADDGRVVGGFEQVLHGGQVLHHARQVHRALDLADDDGRAALAACVGHVDARHQRVRGLGFEAVHRVLALHLGQRGPAGLGRHPQRQRGAVVLEQHAVGLREGVGQGVAVGGHRSASARLSDGR